MALGFGLRCGAHDLVPWFGRRKTGWRMRELEKMGGSPRPGRSSLPPAGTQDRTMSTDPLLQVWLLAGIGMLLAAAVGFAGGVFYERTSLRRLARRTHRHAARLFSSMLVQLDALSEACQALGTACHFRLASHQIGELESCRERLLNALTAVLERQKASDRAAGEGSVGRKPRARKSRSNGLKWAAVPNTSDGALDETREIARKNVALLLESGVDGEPRGGVLLVRVDRVRQLRKRFGAAAAGQFVRKVGELVAGAVRPGDFVGEYGEDTFVALFPGVDVCEGSQLADAIRRSIRQYHFHLNESGPEVLVTASLGYAQCLSEDQPDWVLNRAQHAVSRSERRGRNQLYVCDGTRLAHCPVT